MTSFPNRRDPIGDHLLTPENAAIIIIDFQPVQVASIASRPKRELVSNITALARIAKLYEMPVVLSTVNVRQVAISRRSIRSPISCQVYR